MAKTLRVGIIGTGRAGLCHASAYSRIPDVSVTALWNRTRSRAEDLASNLDAPDTEIFDDWRDLIEKSGVDIISITTDPVVRQQPLVYALERQLHVLVEKPLALNLQEAGDMTAASQQANTVTAVSLNWRYSQACQTMWEAIREGQIGRPLDIQTEWRIHFTPGIKPLTAGRGLLMEMGSHEFDRACFLAGWKFNRVVCTLRLGTQAPGIYRAGPTSSLESYAAVMAELSDGARGTFCFSLTPGEPGRRITICGEEGTLILDNDWVTRRQGVNHEGSVTLGNELRVHRQSTRDSDPVQVEVVKSNKQPGEILSGQHTWNRLINDFVSAVRSGDTKHGSSPHLPHLADGMAAQQVIHACECSHVEQRWVDVTRQPDR